MKSVRNLLERPSIWLRHEGPENETVLSTRIRFARNLAGRPFPQRAAPTTRAELLRDILETTQDLSALDNGLRLRLEPLEKLERRLLGERQLLSQDLVDTPRYRGVVIAADEALSFMINEEDHLRIQALKSGYDLETAFEMAEQLEADLGERLDYAFSHSFGFLTACPTNAGTGMRASVLMHLPGLVLGQKMEAQLKALQERDVTVRGFHGEGTTAMGNFFQVSNSVTLGVRESDILARIGEVVSKLVDTERAARGELLDRSRTLLEDRIWRDVLTWSQEAHTELLSGREGDEAQRGVWRASEIRKKLRSSKS
jgi:protein arginine kinase